MKFYDFQNKLLYEPVEIKFVFKDLRRSLPDGSCLDISNTYPARAVFACLVSPDLLKAEKVPGILSRAKTVNNLALPRVPVNAVIRRVLARIVLPNGDQLKNDFDDDGHLSTTGYPDGVQVIYHYDDKGRCSKIESTGGSSVGIGYDTKGRIETISQPGEGTFKYLWAAGDSLEQVRYPDGSLASFGYNDNGALSKIKCRGDAIAVRRDKAGRVAGVIANDQFAYDFPAVMSNKVYHIHRVPDGRDTEKIITPTGIFTRSNGRLVTKLGIDGQITIYRYSDDGSVSAIWGNSGATICDTPSSTISPDGTRVLRVVDSQRSVAYMISPFSADMESYDSEKLMVTFVNNSGLRVTNRYDKSGRIKMIEHPVEGKTKFFYGKQGQLIRILAENVVELRLGYEEASGKITSVTGEGPVSAVIGLSDYILSTMLAEGN